jgi:uncharacterized protein YceK
MTSTRVLCVSLIFLLNGCSSIEKDEISTQASTDSNVEQSNKYYYWKGNSLLGPALSITSFDQPFHFVSATATMQAGTHDTSDAYINIFNTDSVLLGNFHARIFDFNEGIIEFSIDDTTVTNRNALYMEMYSWPNIAKLQELVFYDTSYENKQIDSVELSPHESQTLEKEEVMEGCVYWTGSRPIDTNIGVVNLDNTIETETLVATLQSMGEGESTVVMQVYNIDNIKIAESTIQIKNYERELVKMFFEPMSDDLSEISRIEFYSDGNESRLVQLMLCGYSWEDEVGC